MEILSTIGLILVLIFIVGTIIHMYKNLINLNSNAENSYAQIDVQLKRKNDLIPDLVKTVKEHAPDEEVIEEVTKANDDLINANGAEEACEANNRLNDALNKLFKIAENYPDLKNNSDFQQLKEQLKDSESKISYSGEFYNAIVTKYNFMCEKFPSNLFARILKLKPAEFFEYEEEYEEEYEDNE